MDLHEPGGKKGAHMMKNVFYGSTCKRGYPPKRERHRITSSCEERGRKEGRKGISRSAYLWSRFATDAHAFLLKDKSKELDVVRMELHKARVITSQAKSPSIQTTF